MNSRVASMGWLYAFLLMFVIFGCRQILDDTEADINPKPPAQDNSFTLSGLQYVSVENSIELTPSYRDPQKLGLPTITLWESSDTIKLKANGRTIQGLSPQKGVVITATSSENEKASHTITVFDLDLEPNLDTVLVGETITINPNIMPLGVFSTDINLTWSYGSVPDQAQVIQGENGAQQVVSRKEGAVDLLVKDDGTVDITGVERGSILLTARAVDGGIWSKEITVTALAIIVEDDGPVIALNQEIAVTATPVDSFVPEKPYSWSIVQGDDNISITTLDQGERAIVKGSSIGKAEISVASSDVYVEKAKRAIEVYDLVTDLSRLPLEDVPTVRESLHLRDFDGRARSRLASTEIYLNMPVDIGAMVNQVEGGLVLLSDIVWHTESAQNGAILEVTKDEITGAVTLIGMESGTVLLRAEGPGNGEWVYLITIHDERMEVGDTYAISAGDFIIDIAELRTLVSNNTLDEKILEESQAKAWHLTHSNMMATVQVSDLSELSAGVEAGSSYAVELSVESEPTTKRTIMVTVTDENTVIGSEYGIYAESFTVDIAAAHGLDESSVMSSAGAKAWKLADGNTATIEVGGSLPDFTTAEDGDIFQVTLQVQDEPNTMRVITISVIGENTAVGREYAIFGRDFVMSLPKATSHGIDVSSITSTASVKAWRLFDGESVDFSVNLDNIPNPIVSGEFLVPLEVLDADNNDTGVIRTIKVTVYDLENLIPEFIERDQIFTFTPSLDIEGVISITDLAWSSGDSGSLVVTKATNGDVTLTGVSLVDSVTITAQAPDEGEWVFSTRVVGAPFIITYEIPTGGAIVDLPLRTEGDMYDLYIFWGDSTTYTHVKNSSDATYLAEAGNLDVTIYGDLRFGDIDGDGTDDGSWGDKTNNFRSSNYLIGVKSFGTVQFIHNTHSFANNPEFNSLPIDEDNTPRISGSAASFFMGAKKFNQPLNHWNVSEVTNMSYMFSGAREFNQNISNWDVSSVVNMGYMFHDTLHFDQPLSWGSKTKSVTNMMAMFYKAILFNQNIGGWDVGNVINMSHMFRDAGDFNQNISSWDVSSVTNMSHMFSGAGKFNQNISSWDVSRVTIMDYMFHSALRFNQPLNWGVKTKSVTNMKAMFYQAPIFNQNISGWLVSSVKDMSFMFNAASAFNQNISSWDVSSVTNMNYMFGGVEIYNQPLNWGTKTSSVMHMKGMFQGAKKFNQDIRSWDVSSVTDMSYMFSGAWEFNQDIRSWDISSVTKMDWMFNQTYKFNYTLRSWNVTGKSTNQMFRESNLLTKLSWHPVGCACGSH